MKVAFIFGWFVQDKYGYCWVAVKSVKTVINKEEGYAYIKYFK